MKEERIKNMDYETLWDIVTSWGGEDSKFVWEDEILHEDDIHKIEAELDKRRANVRDMQ